MWDPLQRQVLEALGHAPLVLAPPDLPADPLLDAVLRAAGRSRDSGDLASVLRALPSMAHLRHDPSAKRALWPQLRTLRATLR